MRGRGGTAIDVLWLILLPANFGYLILVPRILIVKGKMSRTIRHGHAQEVGLFERPDLRVQRIAHAVEPRTGQVGIVPA